MKKITLVSFSIAMLFFLQKSNAQSFEPGTSAINLGVGFVNSYDYAGAGLSSTPVIAGSYEYSVGKLGPGSLGIGGQIGYQGASSSYDDGSGDTYSDKWTSILVGVRGVYHPDFCNGDKYDIYGALQLSYVHFGFSETASGPNTGNNVFGFGGVGGSTSSFYPYLVIGGRYYFTPGFGIFAEIGYSLAFLNAGISFKFGGGK